MSLSKPLHVGSLLSLNGVVYELVALDGPRVLLSDQQRGHMTITLAALLADKTFQIVGAEQSRRPLRPAYFNSLSEEACDRALRFERHVSEAADGLPVDAEPGSAPRPKYDPMTTSQSERDAAKVAELAALGEPLSLRSFRRFRRQYEISGIEALIDKRPVRKTSVASRVDNRYVEVLRRVLAESRDDSTGTRGKLMRLTTNAVEAEYGPDQVPLPSRATFNRLLARMAEARHATGSARTRRTLANQPQGPFGALAAARPGEWMQIDSSPLDVAVRLDQELTGRVELTVLVDLATRSIAAAVLRPTAKAVDAALLLARSMTPEPMRPGWSDAVSMARSALPYQSMRSADERLENAAAKPVIVPENIVCDNGSIYVSSTFLNACRRLGISRQRSHPFTPTDKPVVERTFSSINTLFAQHVVGYLGSSVEHRGQAADQKAVFSLVELQDLLDEWVVVHWQNRPHEGLRDPLSPSRVLTPNEMYAALVAVSGYVHLPLSPEDYIGLQPFKARAINSYGIKIGHRVYDCEELNPLRGQPSGIKALKDQWEVHYDPHDVTRVWVQNPETGAWITAYWRYLRTSRQPFSETVWEHARKIVAARDKATEEAIAAETERILDDASTGRTAAFTTPKRKKSPRDRRVAARANAMAEVSKPDVTHAEETVGPARFAEPADDERLAEVIPLPVFDTDKMLEKWW
ncbi:Mu transposase C-terminal domain-containing protein [Segniliparus rugosus]|uniref:Integrase catalytic domain-containing protein n=1 Tax=Segniliparus rugosus (strain ATCC BAA-974 / DSM 45345 / CCUG 50838 / CIP 108380 / JCM 13579 / CDC 945) TaxID=679197 RepID=E5XPA9_SEGRC|nr:Mu transposase C-terminal domain-containing protein [Segniliparus rugosus]EFV13818.1 hypothetical protein HMPREF9336_01331 [Segniliparus rugosus ATCC BAA-974]